QGTGPGGSILLGGKQFFQLRVLSGPAVFIRVESVRQAAPADVLGQDFLFFRGSAAPLRLDGLQGTDGLNVAGKLLLWPAFAQMLVGDAEVSGRWGRNFRLRQLNMESFDHHIVG